MKNRDYIALEFAKALIPVYWDTESAYEHVDVFIAQMTPV